MADLADIRRLQDCHKLFQDFIRTPGQYIFSDYSLPAESATPKHQRHHQCKLTHGGSSLDTWPNSWHQVLFWEQSMIPFCGSFAQRPKNWDDVRSYRKWLAPFFGRYAQITGSPRPPTIPPWHSRIYHIAILQRKLRSYWENNRLGDPPVLIYEVANPSKKYDHPSIRLWKWPEGSLPWYEQQQDHTWKEIDDHIHEAKGSAVPDSGLCPADKPESHDIHDILDSIIARNPVGYLWWLTCLGYAYYIPEAQSQTWDDWCTWFAPTAYEGWIRLKKPTKMPWERESKYLLRLSGPRPAITLQQANSGHITWAASRKHVIDEPDLSLLRAPDPKRRRLFFPTVGRDSNCFAPRVSDMRELHAYSRPLVDDAANDGASDTGSFNLPSPPTRYYSWEHRLWQPIGCHEPSSVFTKRSSHV